MTDGQDQTRELAREIIDRVRGDANQWPTATDYVEEKLRAYRAEVLSERDARTAELEAALRDLFNAVCGETGFAAAVRNDSGTPYPWPALDAAEEKARQALRLAENPTGSNL